ncbi:MAG: hypothetical protein WCC03_02550 [Candidatus Acidiferrales bacterium]
MKSAWPGLAILLLLPVNSVFARPPQPQQYHEEDPSNVADAARRTRDQKKEQSKPAKVWDNDTIPKTPGAVSVIGPAPAAAEGDDAAAGADAKDADASAKAATAGAEGADNAGKPANEGGSGAPAPAAATEAGGATGSAATDEKAKGGEASAEVATIQSDLAAAKAQLQTAKADLDILQRKFNLDSQTYYGKPDYAADKEGAAAIDAEKGQVEAKQQEVADAQMKVDQLEAKLSNAR